MDIKCPPKGVEFIYEEIKETKMIEWIVVYRFGNQIAGPFFDKIAAENVAKAIPNATIIPKH